MLAQKGVKVPEGDEFNSIEEAKLKAGNYINKSVVIKPKSTNFWIGINIFPNGANLEDIVHAFEIALKNDNTVLIEEFIKEKNIDFSYWWWSCRILHRVLLMLLVMVKRL